MRITINEVSGGHNKLSKDDFIKNAQLAHQNPDGTPKYDYSKIIFNGDYVENIICPEHGPFKVKRTLHVRKNRGKCPEENYRKKTKHNDNELKDAASKVDSTAEFKIKYNSEYNAAIKRGYDFYKDITKHFKEIKTIGEKNISDILEMMDLDFIAEKSFEGCLGDNCGRLRFDFYLPEYKTCIEYDGDLHFKPSKHHDKGDTEKFLKRIRYDKLKNEYCVKNNIKLIRISYKTKKIEDIFEEIKKGLESNDPIYLSKDYPKLGWYDPEMNYLYDDEKYN